MEVIVTGSRYFGLLFDRDRMTKWMYEQAMAERKLLFEELDKINPTLVITGGAAGADDVAVTWAKNHGVPYKVYPAEWALYGKAAGPIRNAEMLDNHPDAFILAVPRNNGPGTKDCIRQAKRRKRKIKII